MLGGFVRGGHGGVQGRELAHHTLVGILFVGMHCLGMLTEIVETRELFSTMAGERTFAGVLPNVPGQVFAPAKNHATIAITTTLERFCRRGTITPVHARAVLEVRLGVREDEGCGHVSVGGVRGRGVHYRGEGGEERAGEKLDRYKHFPCLIFFLFIFYLKPFSR